jgi:hypothetical protein
MRTWLGGWRSEELVSYRLVIFVDAARAAGLPAAAVTWGSARAEILRAHKPDFVADSFAELSAIIRQGQCRPQKG